jgi:hypothetical protein
MFPFTPCFSRVAARGGRRRQAWSRCPGSPSVGSLGGDEGRGHGPRRCLQLWFLEGEVFGGMGHPDRHTVDLDDRLKAGGGMGVGDG